MPEGTWPEHKALCAPRKPPIDRCTGCNRKFAKQGQFYSEATQADACTPTCYHGARGKIFKAYVGDRHPEDDRVENPGAFEAAARACGNCGEMKHCMKPDDIKQAVELSKRWA
ncbi:hypothetical protein HWV62_859 [Athelia sp. TMB]|nr:hypothetical protein HWV62_859 [Athelia sp. TMB]